MSCVCWQLIVQYCMNDVLGLQLHKSETCALWNRQAGFGHRALHATLVWTESWLLSNKELYFG